jgi:hypothetical protein
MITMQQFGFKNKDIDEIKAIFDTNHYLLLISIIVAFVHVKQKLINFFMIDEIKENYFYYRYYLISWPLKMIYHFGDHENQWLDYHLVLSYGVHLVKVLYYYICLKKKLQC